jgi:hypothetical protein
MPLIGLLQKFLRRYKIAVFGLQKHPHRDRLHESPLAKKGVSGSGHIRGSVGSDLPQNLHPSHTYILRDRLRKSYSLFICDRAKLRVFAMSKFVGIGILGYKAAYPSCLGSQPKGASLIVMNQGESETTGALCLC